MDVQSTCVISGLPVSSMSQHHLQVVTAGGEGKVRVGTARWNVGHRRHLAVDRLHHREVRMEIRVLRVVGVCDGHRALVVLPCVGCAGDTSANHKARARLHREVDRVDGFGGKEVVVAADDADADEPEILRASRAPLRQHMGLVLPHHRRSEIHERSAQV